jgi:ribokinase
MGGASGSAVVVAGGINLDLVVRTPRLPRPGETVRGGDLLQVPGGKGANQATAVARLGGEARLLALVGDDAHGDVLLRTLEEDDIATAWVRRLNGVPSGVALIPVADDGTNCIIVAPGANGRADGHLVMDAAPSLFTGARVAIGQLEWPEEAIRTFLEQTPAGVLRMLNAAPAHAGLLPLLPGVDWLVVNEVEAHLLSGVPVDDVARARLAGQRLRELGVRNVAITLGGVGVVYVGEDGAVHQPAPQVEVVDTTAAGDAFVGALALALTQGAVAPALRFAVAAGSLACATLGARPSLPRREAVERLLPSVPAARKLPG